MAARSHTDREDLSGVDEGGGVRAKLAEEVGRTEQDEDCLLYTSFRSSTSAWIAANATSRSLRRASTSAKASSRVVKFAGTLETLAVNADFLMNIERQLAD